MRQLFNWAVGPACSAAFQFSRALVGSSLRCPLLVQAARTNGCKHRFWMSSSVLTVIRFNGCGILIADSLACSLSDDSTLVRWPQLLCIALRHVKFMCGLYFGSGFLRLTICTTITITITTIVALNINTTRTTTTTTTTATATTTTNAITNTITITVNLTISLLLLLLLLSLSLYYCYYYYYDCYYCCCYYCYYYYYYYYYCCCYHCHYQYCYYYSY